MATRINNLLPEASPSPSANLAIDASTTMRTTVQAVVNAGAPVPTESDAVAGLDNNARMTPLRVKQFVNGQIGTTLATAAQGALAETAVQPGELDVYVPIYATAQGLAAVEVPVTFDAIRVNGFTTENDGRGGLYVTGAGTGYRGFTSDGGARGWDYVPPELPESAEITVGTVSGDFVGTAGIQAAYAAANQLIKSTKSVTIKLTGHFSKSTSGFTLRADSPSGKQIKIRGLTPVQTTLLNIVDVTGVSGAWVVRGTVADATGIVAGDFIRLKSVVPGYHSIYTYTGKPVIGELRMMRVPLGKLSITSLTATVSFAALNTFMDVNNLIVAKGQCRRVSAIGSETQFSIASPALQDDIPSDPGENWWYQIRHSGVGTVAVADKIVTGTSTVFTNLYNRGDYIAIQGGSIGRVVSIESDTQLTLESTMGTIASGRHHGPITRGHHHEGGWRITNVAGNVITWVNESTCAYPPPAVRVIGGDVSVLKSSIQDAGPGSAILVDTFLDMDDIAIAGDLGTGTWAINGYGDGRGKASQVRLGTGMMTLGYDYGFYGEMGSLHANEVSFCGADLDGCYPANGVTVIGVDVVANGNGRRGLVGYGGSVNYTGARTMGNGDDGYWGRAGPGILESLVSEDNGRGGSWVVGIDGTEAVQGRFMGNQFGVINENGGTVRYSGAMIACNKRRGIYNLDGKIEAVDAHIISNGSGLTDDAGYWGRSNGTTRLEGAGFYKNSTNIDVDAMMRTDLTRVTQIV